MKAKTLKHLWLYLTSPMYRWHIHLYNEQEMIDRLHREYEAMLECQSKAIYQLEEK